MIIGILLGVQVQEKITSHIWRRVPILRPFINSQPQEQGPKIQVVLESNGRPEKTVVHIVTVVRERRICVRCSNGWFLHSEKKVEKDSKIEDASGVEGDHETEWGCMFKLDDIDGRKKG